MTYPKDKYIIPLVVPAIVVAVEALNNDPLPQLMRHAWFWRDTAAGIIITASIWWLIRRITLALDQRWEWRRQFYKRLLWQSLLGWVFPAVVLFGLCWLVFEFVIGQPMFETFFPYYEYPFSVLLLAGMNGYYLIYNLLQRETETRPQPQGTETTYAPLFAFKGADRFPLRHTMVSVIIKGRSAYLDVYTFDGERLNMSGTMDGVEKNLPGDVFFRINRQVIMHADGIKSFRSIENGKIEIHCETEGVGNPIVSQKKAAEFRKWISKARNEPAIQ